jgi:aspartate carbamoyltransferase regulatory subunit
MQVDKIEIGTVIDHIQAGKAGKILRLLRIGEDYGHRVAMMMNVPSKRMKTKDIVKIEGKMVSQEEANVIALVCPGATINVIKDAKVEKKFKVELPKEVGNYAKCANPNCITNSENAGRRFVLEGSRFRCHHCERLFRAEELV